MLERLAVLAPFGVSPARAAGQEVVLEAARGIARGGTRVDLITLGMRRFERRWPRGFTNEIEPRLTEHRVLSLRFVLDRMLRRTSRVPPLDFELWLSRAGSRVREKLEGAHAIQLESPWAHPFAARFGKPTALVVHNHEAQLHCEVLTARRWLERAEAIEGRAWRECDLVFVTHEGEEEAMRESYGEPRGRVLRLPFGVDTASYRVAEASERLAARRALGIPEDATVGLFTGSAHAPNRSAADFLRESGAEFERAGVFVLVAGSVCPAESFRGGRATGPLPEMNACFAAADFGLHPITEGRGMNVKVAQMLACGLPVLATEFGARGYGETPSLVRVPEPESFPDALTELLARTTTLRELGRIARAHAEEELSWDRVAAARAEALEQLVVSTRGAALR